MGIKNPDLFFIYENKGTALGWKGIFAPGRLHPDVHLEMRERGWGEGGTERKRFKDNSVFVCVHIYLSV